MTMLCLLHIVSRAKGTTAFVGSGPGPLGRPSRPSFQEHGIGQGAMHHQLTTHGKHLHCECPARYISSIL